MSHQIADEKVRQEISNAVESVERYLVSDGQFRLSATEDLMLKIREGWTLERLRGHILYQILFLRWHLCNSSAECNPDRFFIAFVKEEAEANGTYDDKLLVSLL
jgi:hypothetical protein